MLAMPDAHYPGTKVSPTPRRCSWPPSQATLSQVVTKMDHQLCPSFVDEGIWSLLDNERMVVVRGKVMPVIRSEDVSTGTDGSSVTRMSARRRRIASIFQHYYPEGGWGVVLLVAVIMVQVLVHGLVLSYGVIFTKITRRFRASITETGFLGSLSPSISLLISPITISFCRRKSTRLTAVLGGLVTSLGCLFASFAGQFHQLLLSYGLVLGVGVGLARDTSTLMVGQYFKRRREFVEIFLVAGSGFGISIMSLILNGAMKEIGWRLGLQAVTGLLSTTFILGLFYRSASLYHPQRRAILHLKSQKRKIKEKNKSQSDKLPFFDISSLKSVTIRIIAVSVAISSFGMITPIFYLASQAQVEGISSQDILHLQGYLGLAWAAGCVVFGSLCIQKSGDCQVGRQYLCQASLLICGITILALPTVQGYNGYVMFVWVYGIFIGGYNYALKLYVYQKVRARNFSRAWSYIQCSQAIPNLVGVAVTGYVNNVTNSKAGYYFSAVCVLLGSLILFCINIHKSILRSKRKLRHIKKRLCSDLNLDSIPDYSPVHVSVRKMSYDEYFPTNPAFTQSQNSLDNILDFKKPELTCISEEGIADMDLPDNLLDELEYLDNITSCNKVENYLMLSEYEQNLIKEIEGPVSTAGRKGRKWSLVRQSSSLHKGPLLDTIPETHPRRKSGDMSSLRSGVRKLFPAGNRSISTIPEAEV